MDTKGHKRYRLKNGQIIPGTTTIVGQLAKPALIAWANRKGLEGVDSGKYVDDTAEIGILAHSIIIGGLEGRFPSFLHFDRSQQDAASLCVRSWDTWLRGRVLEPIFLEHSMVSEIYRFGGTLDIYAEVDGVKTLIDLKTTNDLWPEHYIQVSAYRQLLIEAGHTVDAVRILNIPRSRTSTFKEVVLSPEALDKNFEIFKHLLRIYEIRKELKYV